MDLTVTGVIRNDQEEMVGVIFEDGKKLMISDWEHKLVATFDKVLFRVPQKGKFSKFIEKAITLKNNGKILQFPSYWRFGVKVGKVLVTRTFKFIGDKHDEFLTRNRMPFGEEVVGKINICLSENKKTREKRIIIDYLLSIENPKKAEHCLKIGGKITEKTIQEFQIPGTDQKIIINKV